MLIERDWRNELEPILRHAGDIVCSYFGKQLPITEKKEHGFVTQADIASEQYLIQELKKLLPQAEIIAEESGQSGNSEYYWVIDPIDGTTNFAHGLPYFCISVALTYQDKPIVAAIYQPLQDEFYFAQHDGPAYLNGQEIQVSKPATFKQALIGVGIPYEHEMRQKIVHMAENIALQAYGIRHFGSIALDLAHVASGRLDGVIFLGLAWWDVTAGMLLIERAGGLITDFDGKILTPDYTTCITGGYMVYNRLKTLLDT